jgi:hypothetical protein
MMLAEASKPELLVKAFDIDYAWPLHGTLNEVLLNGAPASEFKRSWDESVKQFHGVHYTCEFPITTTKPCRCRFAQRGAGCLALMFSSGRSAAALQWHGGGRCHRIGDPALFEKLPIFWQPKGRPACARFTRISFAAERERRLSQHKRGLAAQSMKRTL